VHHGPVLSPRKKHGEKKERGRRWTGPQTERKKNKRELGSQGGQEAGAAAIVYLHAIVTKRHCQKAKSKNEKKTEQSIFIAEKLRRDLSNRKKGEKMGKAKGSQKKKALTLAHHTEVMVAGVSPPQWKRGETPPRKARTQNITKGPGVGRESGKRGNGGIGCKIGAVIPSVYHIGKWVSKNGQTEAAGWNRRAVVGSRMGENQGTATK